MRLEVHEHDTRAIARYEKSGYRLFGRHRDYYDDRGDALRFEKPLGAEPRHRPAVPRSGLTSAAESVLMVDIAVCASRQPLFFQYDICALPDFERMIGPICILSARDFDWKGTHP